MSDMRRENSAAVGGTSFSIQLRSTGVEDTIAIGLSIGSILRAGDVVALVGQLGAGKTHLTKGLALGMAVPDARQVNSPTFVLMNEYQGRLAIRHIDAYRLAGAEELGALGFEELVQAGCVVIIEWADRAADALPDQTLWAEMTPAGESARRLHLYSSNADWVTRFSASDLTRFEAGTIKQTRLPDHSQ